MKYKLKVDNIYIIFLIMMTLIVILILTFGTEKVFSLKEAIFFVMALAVPMYLIFAWFYGTTYLKIADKGIVVYYFGTIRKLVYFKQIKLIEKADDGRGILSLSQDKLLLVINGQKYFVSLKENDKFRAELCRVL